MVVALTSRALLSMGPESLVTFGLKFNCLGLKGGTKLFGIDKTCNHVKLVGLWCVSSVVLSAKSLCLWRRTWQRSLCLLFRLRVYIWLLSDGLTGWLAKPYLSSNVWGEGKMWTLLWLGTFLRRQQIKIQWKSISLILNQKKAIIITSKHGTRIFFPITILF